MAFQGISTGSGPNVGDGDTLIGGALKINSNFSEIYTFLGDGTDLTNDYILTSEVDGSSIEFTSNTLNVKTGGITNDMLAGSIANNKLSNSELSYGGVALSLGGSVAQPAFDLTNATNYQTSNLSGSIADNQLASTFIKTSEVDNSSIEFTSSTLNVKTGGITNDMLAGSIADGKLSSTFLKNVSGDTSPTLGGNLNANSNSISNANNLAANGTVTAGSGFYIGISSAGSNISNGPITRLNFAGDGNEISVDGNGVVSITIAGTGAGVVDAFPQIGNVTLTEDVTSGARFTGKNFTASYTMTTDSNPASTKSIKGILTGSFPVYPTGSISGNSVNTNNNTISNSFDILSYYPNIDANGVPIGTSDAGAFVVCPTPGGAGNGPGYYVHTFGMQYYASDDSSWIATRTFWTPDQQISVNNTLLFERVTPFGAIYSTSAYESTLPYNGAPVRIVTYNGIAWMEHYLYKNPSQSTTLAEECVCWEDETGDIIVGTVGNPSISSDGEVVYRARSHSSSNYDGIFYYKNTSGNWTTVSIDGFYQGSSSFTNNTRMSAVVYNKPSNEVVFVYFYGLSE